MFIEMLLGVGVGVAIILAILAIIGTLVVLFTAGSIIYSRVAFALLFGWVVGNQNDLVASSFLNFLVWAAIGAAIVFSLSSLPRSNSAISYFCTVFITSLVVSLVGAGAVSIYHSIAKTGVDFQITTGYEILIKAVSLFFAIGAYIKQYEHGSLFMPTGVVFVTIDRLIASVVIGFSFTYLATAWNGNWNSSETLQWIVLIIGTILAFVADMFLNRE